MERPAGLWVPVGRSEVARLFNEPSLLRLYCHLRDETYRAQWSYGQDYQEEIYYCGYLFEWIWPHVFLFDLGQYAAQVDLSEGELYGKLKTLYRQGCIDAVHFGVHLDLQTEVTRSIEGFGLALDELLGPNEPYEYRGERNWNVVYMRPLEGGFVRIPRAALGKSAPMLRMIVYLYTHATYRGREVRHRSRYYTLRPGEVVASYADLERVLGEHRRQICRWAEYALRDGLVSRIPQGHDALWRVKSFPRKPKP